MVQPVQEDVGSTLTFLCLDSEVRGEERGEGEGGGERGRERKEREGRGREGSLIQLFKEKIEVEKLTTEPVVASSQPIEKPRCFVAQSQLMGEVQCIILIKGMESGEERGEGKKREKGGEGKGSSISNFI